MTTSRTRKSTTPADMPRSKAKTTKAPEPMDPEVVEVTPQAGEDGTIDVQAHAPFSDRNCWALDVLVREVADLYPEATHYISERNGRGVGTAVTFENWDDHHENDPGLPQVLSCLETDPRVAEVTDEGNPEGPDRWVFVRMIANPVTMDTRDEFGLAKVYAIMTASDD